VHLSLAPLALLTFWLPPPSTSSGDSKPTQSSKFGAATNCWGTESVILAEVEQWENNMGDAADLSVKCEELYQSFRKAEEVTMDYEIATEHM